jgi:signal transduction histidine kinase
MRRFSSLRRLRAERVLCAMSRHSTPEYGRQAHASLMEDDIGILIRVDDEGPGIPEELQEDAFRPFRRLEASRNRETGGMGLGLAVARTIIRAHGGDVTLTNRKEGGLRAEVRLPKQ